MKKLFGKKPRAANDEDAAQRNHQGISATGNALRAALLQGLALLLLPLLLLGAWQLLVEAPAQRDALLLRLTETQAQQLARQLGNSVAALRRLLEDAAAAPELAQLPAGAPAEALTPLEQRLLERLPGALSLRLLPIGDLGVAQSSAYLETLRNHIEIDLAQRAGAAGSAGPEAYRIDDEWLVSLAQHSNADGAQAVLLLSLNETALRSLLPPLADTGGQLLLRQRFANREVDVLRSGPTTAATPGATAEVPETDWQLEYHPSSALVESVRSSTRPPYLLLLTLLLFGSAALVVSASRSGRLLRAEVQRIRDSADSRSSLALQFPQLLPVARELRKLTLRRSRPSTPAARAGGSPAVPSNIASSLGSGDFDGPAAQALPATIFRAYDIRGLAEQDLDDETVFRIGSAVATLAGELNEQTLVIACDGRNSSPRIKAVVEKALLRAGRDVVDIGLVPTPLLYFATQRADCSSGIMITGSHNPPDCNGLKIVLGRRTVASGTIAQLRDMAQRGEFSKGTGKRMQRDVAGDYLDEVSADIAIAIPLTIVVDAGNGATAAIAPTLLEELGCEVVPLYCEVDGDFPNRSPDTSNEANLQPLVEKVRETSADFGVAFDGDGDRIAVVTGSGRIMRTDTLMMLLARDVVSRNPGADVVYDVKCSRNLAQLISNLGGRPILSRTGHAPMKEKMIETGALLGGEFSGHVFFGERWYGFDDGLYAAARLAEIIAAQDASLDEMLADLPVAVSTPEILVPVSDEEKFDVVRRFTEQAQFPDGKVQTLDGLRVDFSDGWGLLRASNTTAALTARFEATDEATLESIMGRFREQLAVVAPSLAIPF